MVFFRSRRAGHFVFASAALGGVVFVACVGADPISSPLGQVDSGVDSASTDSGNPSDGSVKPDANVDLDAGSDPDADAAPPAKKRIFITTAERDGNFPGVAVADNFCQTTADAVQAAGEFMAFLSIPGKNAIDRLPSNGPWYSMDRNTLLFTGKTTGAHPIAGVGPAAPINLNEYGQALTNPMTSYWTGTSAGGVVSDSHCLSWTNNQTGAGFQAGTTGRVDKIDFGWTAFQTYTCYSPMHVLCFEK